MNMFGYECRCVAIGEGKDTRYQLFSNEVGPLGYINISYLGKSDTVIAVNDYSEMAGTLDALKELGIVKAELGHVQSGFIKLPLVEIDKEKLLSA